MTKNRTNILTSLMVMFLISCNLQTKKNQNINKETKHLKDSIFLSGNDLYINKETKHLKDSMFLSGNNLYKDSLIQFYTIGMNCIENNDTVLFNKLMNHYYLSSYPSSGISISYSMACINKYGRAYYITYDLISRYSISFFSKRDSLNYFTEDMLYLLSSAKKYGYFFDVEICNNDTIWYEDLK